MSDYVGKDAAKAVVDILDTQRHEPIDLDSIDLGGGTWFEKYLTNQPFVLNLNPSRVDYRSWQLGSMFYSAYVTQVIIPNATSIPFIFTGCSWLQKVYTPKVSSVPAYCYSHCIKLTDLAIEDCSFIDYQAFEGCVQLSKLVAPKLSVIEQSAFVSCTRLQYISAPLTRIGSGAFAGCQNLSEIHLTSNYCCTLSNSDAFMNCNSALRIFVPANKLSDYQTSTNWVYYSSRFVGV